MGRAVIVVLVVLTIVGAVRLGLRRLVRERVWRQMEPLDLRRVTRHVWVWVLVTGTPRWRGFDARRRSRVRADLYLLEGRFVLSSEAGTLLDVRAGGAGLRSVRCTGPGRLVVEGPVRDSQGLFRLEVVLPDAQGWARDLAPMQAGGQAQVFGSFGESQRTGQT